MCWDKYLFPKLSFVYVPFYFFFGLYLIFCFFFFDPGLYLIDEGTDQKKLIILHRFFETNMG